MSKVLVRKAHYILHDSYYVRDHPVMSRFSCGHASVWSCKGDIARVVVGDFFSIGDGVMFMLAITIGRIGYLPFRFVQSYKCQERSRMVIQRLAGTSS